MSELRFVAPADLLPALVGVGIEIDVENGALCAGVVNERHAVVSLKRVIVYHRLPLVRQVAPRQAYRDGDLMLGEWCS